MSHHGDGYILLTPTVEMQVDTEDECRPFFVDLNTLPPRQLNYLRRIGLLVKESNSRVQDGSDQDDDDDIVDASMDVQLMREKHVDYLMTPFRKTLQKSYMSLDSSRPWIIYWCLHGLDLLGTPLGVEDAVRVIDTLKSCFTYEGDDAISGGFGGGPRQMAHCATNYAAVLALCVIGGASTFYDDDVRRAAYDAIDRKALYKWFLSLRQEFSVTSKSGVVVGKRVGFRMHDDGEVDVRGTYTVLCIAKLLNMLTEELTAGVPEYIAACQTYEGGFGAEAFNEAHGGYTYCAVAGLHILNRMEECNIDLLRKYLARMQLNYEGGFSGRTNKLVDGCYTFWQGAAMAILNVYDHETQENGFPSKTDVQSGLLETVFEVGSDDDQGVDIDAIIHVDENGKLLGGLMYNQGLLQRYTLLCAQSTDGGLRDKPSKPRDFYHSCYNLSGLSVSQHILSENGIPVVYGSSSNLVRATHPTFNIQISHVEKTINHFSTIELENSN